jgi:MFS family permease
MRKNVTDYALEGFKIDKSEEEAERFLSETGRLVLLSTALASSMLFINQIELNIALPSIQSALGDAGSEHLWITNGFNLMIASLVCGFSTITSFLFGAGITQGTVGATMVPGSYAIITAIFPSDRRGKTIGTWSAATIITTLAGSMIGGAFSEAGIWLFLFFINLPLRFRYW